VGQFVLHSVAPQSVLFAQYSDGSGTQGVGVGAGVAVGSGVGVGGGADGVGTGVGSAHRPPPSIKYGTAGSHRPGSPASPVKQPLAAPLPHCPSPA
jgi:hypothetical protein